jgi:DNA-directed RNA polymerase subunit alpha
MAQSVESELRELVLGNSSFGPEDIRRISQRISSDYARFVELRDLTQQLENQDDRSPAAAVRLGVCQFLLGHYRVALSTLANADGGALSLFYAARAHSALGQYRQACDAYEAAKTAGYDADACRLGIAEAQRLRGNTEEAMQLLDNMFGPIEQSAEYLFQRAATIAAKGDNPEEVVRLYERAVEADPRHGGALFGLAMENDRRGNDDRALQLYERAAAVFPTHVGVLLNLGLLYEDYEQYDRARRCYDRILDADPTNARAHLFLRDAMASSDDHYDPESQKRLEQLSHVLKIPVAQFELSVRSRNCLQKMGIHTLGDLTRVTEQELLASKNFGETSLVEIREMLSNRGLVIGQFAHEKEAIAEPLNLAELSPDAQAVLDRPIPELNLSVRARKCMSRLQLTTIGELIRKTGDDLLECKNFGVTSLNEVREKLAVIGLKLRGE